MKDDIDTKSISNELPNHDDLKQVNSAEAQADLTPEAKLKQTKQQINKLNEPNKTKSLWRKTKDFLTSKPVAFGLGAFALAASIATGGIAAIAFAAAGVALTTGITLYATIKNRKKSHAINKANLLNSYSDAKDKQQELLKDPKLKDPKLNTELQNLLNDFSDKKIGNNNNKAASVSKSKRYVKSLAGDIAGLGLATVHLVFASAVSLVTLNPTHMTIASTNFGKAVGKIAIKIGIKKERIQREMKKMDLAKQLNSDFNEVGDLQVTEQQLTKTEMQKLQKIEKTQRAQTQALEEIMQKDLESMSPTQIKDNFEKAMQQALAKNQDKPKQLSTGFLQNLAKTISPLEHHKIDSSQQGISNRDVLSPGEPQLPNTTLEQENRAQQQNKVNIQSSKSRSRSADNIRKISSVQIGSSVHKSATATPNNPNKNRNQGIRR